MLPSRSKRWLALTSTVLLATVAGCSGDDDNPPPLPATGTAQIRALHASADTPPVDVYINGSPIGTNIAVGNQTGFATVTAASTRVQIARNGSNVSTAPIDIAVPLNSALRYTAVAVGDLTQVSGPERLQAVLIEDGGAPPPGGSAKLRVVHGAPTVGPVDVFVTPASAGLPATPTFANLAFSSVAPASSSPAQVLGAGDYRIRIRPAGQTTVVYDSGSLRIDENTDLVAVAVRDVGPGPSLSPVQMLLFPSTGSANFARDNRKSVRVVHGVPNLLPLDVFLKAPDAANDAVLNRIAAALAFPANTGYLPFAQGNHSEHLPHPDLGQTYRAGKDDFTKWYPDKLLFPGVQPDDPINKNYPNTDLNNAFFIDEAAQKSGYFEARKHHQEYQEHLQSKHAKAGLLTCSDCHSLHSVKGQVKVAAQSCKSCHGDKMDYKAMMPGTAQTAGGFFVRSHAFNPNPRKGGPTSDMLPPPVMAYPKK